MAVQSKFSGSPSNTLDRYLEERAALEAVLDSTEFHARPRLAGLLRYICERYFEGESESLKEYSIATEVFHRPESFDQATDSIVRVEVFRLRKKLRQFYDGEGADQPIEIVIAPGHYRPEFIARESLKTFTLARGGTQELALSQETRGADRDGGSHGGEETCDAAIPEEALAVAPGRNREERRVFLQATVAAATLAVLGAVGVMLWERLEAHRSAQPEQSLSVAEALPPPGSEVRIRCGYSRPIFKDDEGNVWSGDRYFSGGFSVELPRQHIARTRDPELYLTARTGVFSYKIPLARGIYELRLHFAETTYSPASTLGGGENSRVFDVRLDGRPLLSQFDIVSDAGPNTADIRVFRDVEPDADGYLHLDFSGSLGLPMINAIELVPGIAHRLRSIRMVAQNSFLVDKSGNLWMPDTYFSSGRIGFDKVIVNGSAEPGLFAGERYGNFSYALPVDTGSYKVTLYFSEKYWGISAAQNQAIGRRVFDIFCNGVELARRLDIAKEAGPARALIKTYHGLRPNAQGKLIIAFVPDVNYASVDAIEVDQE